MRVWAFLCTLTLLMSPVLSKSHGRYPQQSMEVRNPDIDASWYTGRGIRPVGRFGRQEAGVNRGSTEQHPVRRLCVPIAAEDDSNGNQ